MCDSMFTFLQICPCVFQLLPLDSEIIPFHNKEMTEAKAYARKLSTLVLTDKKDEEKKDDEQQMIDLVSLDACRGDLFSTASSKFTSYDGLSGRTLVNIYNFSILFFHVVSFFSSQGFIQQSRSLKTTIDDHSPCK